MTLIGRRVLAQAVVDVQRLNRPGTRDLYRHVEQAGRVSAAREEHDDRPARYEQPIATDLLEQRAHSSGRCSAMKISVDSVKPFSRTSAIRSNSRCGPARSTTGRVTRTSPPADRAATREAMFTARP